MYPLRRKPSKLFSKVIIVLIWILSFAFALPMGLVHTFGYVPDNNSVNYVEDTGGNSTIIAAEKPFCYIDFGSNVTNSTITVFKYYR